MHVPVRPEAAPEPDRIGTQVLPGVGIIVALVVVVQPAFRVFPLVLEAQLDLDVGVVGGSPVALRQAAGQAGVAFLDYPAVEPAPGTQLAGPDDLAVVADEFPGRAERVGDDMQRLPRDMV
ncbi:nitroreductase [Methylocaldum marinum]|uniref:Nitroreductase n=1 Tax=Methylocaldum marinum TaxID=1432792 RepID=A0A250KV40_9GAMM|nr:nitroreductase [Methylocaldum marinum]